MDKKTKTIAEFLNLGQEFEQQNNLDRAIAIYREAIAAFPHNYQGYNRLGKVLMIQGNLDKAIAFLRQGVKLKPDSPWVYYQLAQALVKQYKWQEAINNYQQAIALQGDFPWSYVHLGHAFQQQQEFTQAINCYRQAIALELKDPWLYHHLAQAYIGLDESQQAIDCYVAGIKLNPNISDLHEQLYFLKQKLNQKEPQQNNLARNNLLEKKLSLKIKSLQQQAKQYLEADKFDLALATYQQIIELDQDYGRIFAQIANVHQQLKQFDQANIFYQKANYLTDFKVKNPVLLVCFSARHLEDKCRFNFLNIVSKINCKKLFIRDIQDTWYNKGLLGITQNVEQTVDYLKNIISRENLNRVIFTGASSGGYAALLFGYLLEVDEVHAFGAQTKIPNNSDEVELLKGIEPTFFDLSKIFLSPSINTKFHLYFDDHFPPDRNHAHYLNQVFPVKLHGYSADIGHKITLWLKLENMLEPIILNAINNKLE